MEARAEEYIKNTIGDTPYIGIHLRMGYVFEILCVYTYNYRVTAV